MSNRENRIYLALWKKAVLSADPVKVYLKSPSEAMSFRRAMYRALLPYKLNKLHDPILSEAIERLGVYQPKLGPGQHESFCWIRQRQGYDMAEGLVGQFDLSDEDLMTEDEKELSHRLSKPVERTEREKQPSSRAWPEPPTELLTPLPPQTDQEMGEAVLPFNPFYKREG